MTTYKEKFIFKDDRLDLKVHINQNSEVVVSAMLEPRAPFYEVLRKSFDHGTVATNNGCDQDHVTLHRKIDDEYTYVSRGDRAILFKKTGKTNLINEDGIQYEVSEVKELNIDNIHEIIKDEAILKDIREMNEELTPKGIGQQYAEIMLLGDEFKLYGEADKQYYLAHHNINKESWLNMRSRVETGYMLLTADRPMGLESSFDNQINNDQEAIIDKASKLGLKKINNGYLLGDTYYETLDDVSSAICYIGVGE